jgi:hypothetical protein
MTQSCIGSFFGKLGIACQYCHSEASKEVGRGGLYRRKQNFGIRYFGLLSVNSTLLLHPRSARPFRNLSSCRNQAIPQACAVYSPFPLSMHYERAALLSEVKQESKEKIGKSAEE